MRKLLCLSLIALFLVPVLVFCEEEAAETEATTGRGMMMRRGVMPAKADKDRLHKYGKTDMMEKIWKKQMVATSDGGVVVLVGNKLLKYDKKLNLVKEAEIKIDFEGMKKMMGKMAEMYPMHMQMKKGCVAKEEAEEETKEEAEEQVQEEE